MRIQFPAVVDVVANSFSRRGCWRGRQQRSRFWLCFGIAASIVLSGCAENRVAGIEKEETSRPAVQPENHPRNVIFMIGDGMALAQATLLNIAQSNRSVLEQFPVVGFHKATQRPTS